jgi:hypothetical protein
MKFYSFFLLLLLLGNFLRNRTDILNCEPLIFNQYDFPLNVSIDTLRNNFSDTVVQRGVLGDSPKKGLIAYFYSPTDSTQKWIEPSLSIKVDKKTRRVQSYSCSFSLEATKETGKTDFLLKRFSRAYSLLTKINVKDLGNQRTSYYFDGCKHYEIHYESTTNSYIVWNKRVNTVRIKVFM